MKEKVLYEKTQVGSRVRYVPVGVERFIYPHGPGVYLVVVDGNCTSVQYNYKTPDMAAVDGALRMFGADLALALMSASRARSGPMTPREQAAFKAYCDVLGDEATLTLTVPSAQEVVDQATTTLRARLVAYQSRGDVEAKNHGYGRIKQLGIPVYRYCGAGKATPLLYVRDTDLTEGLTRNGLDAKTFNSLFGCQTACDRGVYPCDVEAVLERMLSGKKTGTQLVMD